MCPFPKAVIALLSWLLLSGGSSSVVLVVAWSSSSNNQNNHPSSPRSSSSSCRRRVGGAPGGLLLPYVVGQGCVSPTAPWSVVGRRRSSSQRLHRFGALGSGGAEEERVPPEDEKEENERIDEAEQWRRRAAELREQVRRLEDQLGTSGGGGGENALDGSAGRRRRSNNNDEYFVPTRERDIPPQDDGNGRSRSLLHRKRVLVAGANGRLGSMVCRYLLRNFPTTEVVAAVHVVGENSPTARGYGRLSYEVGAEDGVGQLGAAWSEDRTATFQYDPQTMGNYNLQNLRVVECELLDPIQCQSVVQGCDSVIWCATDFNGNQPRAVSSLNVALLFRAVSRPDKGRVEVEGVQNMLGALKLARQEAKRGVFSSGNDNNNNNNNDPINFVLVSVAPEALEDFETPFGSFWDIKRQGERMALQDFPSLTTTVLQLARFEDNFVGEDLDLQVQEFPSSSQTFGEGGAKEDAVASFADANKRARRKINRRDAARAAVDALVQSNWAGKTVQVWTAS